MRSKKRTFYCCGVEYQHELGETTTRLYSTLKELKSERTCWKSCGIVKLTVTAKFIRKQNLFKVK